MSIRPVDLQVAMQRTPEINRAQHAENQRSEVMNQHFGSQLQKEVEHNEHQVMESNKSEQDAINRDGKGKGQRQSSRRDRKPEEQAKDKLIYADEESMFDVKA